MRRLFYSGFRTQPSFPASVHYHPEHDASGVDQTVTLVLFSHRSQLDAYDYLARGLKEEHGVDTELWVLGASGADAAADFEGFENVVVLAEGTPENPSSEHYRQCLAWFRDFEDRIGVRFYRRDVAMDRMFQQTMFNRRDCIPVHCDPRETAAIMYEVGRTIQDRLETLDCRAIVSETNSAPKRLAWRLAALRGLEVVHFVGCRHWPNRGYLKRRLGFEWEDCRRKYREFASKGTPSELRAIAESRLEHITTESVRAKSFEDNDRGTDSLLERFSVKRILDNQLRWLRSRQPQYRRDPNILPPESYSPFTRVRRYLATRTSEQIYEKHFSRDVDLTNDYAVYFLHVQPEATVETMAFEYQDQVATIRNLASYLPADVPLYVKEHKPIAGDRPVHFYTELAHLPSVQLVHDTVHSHELIRRAAVVLTLTGTVGLEAIYYGTPAVVLGDVFFNVFEGIHSPTSLPEAKELLTTPNELSGADRDDAVRTLAATYAASSPGIFPPRPQEDPELSRELVRSFATVI